MHLRKRYATSWIGLLRRLGVTSPTGIAAVVVCSIVLVTTLLSFLVWTRLFPRVPPASLHASRGRDDELPTNERMSPLFVPAAKSIEDQATKNDDGELLRKLQTASRHSHPAFPNLVFIAETNAGFMPMAKNLVHFAARTNPPISKNMVMFALNEQVEREMKSSFPELLIHFDPDDVGEKKNDSPVTTEIKSSSISFTSAMSSKAESFQHPEYNRIVIHKWNLLRRVLRLGFDAFLLDVDVVPLRNPLNYLLDAPVCDAYVATDAFANLERGGEGRYHGYEGTAGLETDLWVNTGVMLFRSSPSTIDMVEGFMSYLEAESRGTTNNQTMTTTEPTTKRKKKKQRDDQTLFNEYLVSRTAGTHPQIEIETLQLHARCADFGGRSFYVLPPCLFATYKHFKDGVVSRCSVTPYTLHFNWIVGYEAKRRAMVKYGLWVDGM